MIRNLTCIVCPLGCQLQVEIEGDKVISVSGNTCKRGEAYGQDECTNPIRTVTSTVRCDNGRLAPVKTDRTIPKEKIGECMRIINETVAHAPLAVGDVISEDIFGARLVATANVEV